MLILLCYFILLETAGHYSPMFMVIFVCVCMCTGDEVIFVNGMLLKVPDVTNTELKLCVTFESSTITDGTVVLAHHLNNRNKLSAYYLNTTNCITPPPPGNYGVGVFTQSHDNILKAPATLPIISLDTVPISEYVLI